MRCHAQLLAAEETEEADREAAAIQSASSLPLSKHEAWQEHWRRQAATHASQVALPEDGVVAVTDAAILLAGSEVRAEAG